MLSPVYMNSLRWMVLFLTAFTSGLSLSRADTLTVFAAASLSDSLSEITAQFERDSGHSVRFSFGASGMLARQIGEGAPADVFVSADEIRLDLLENAGRLKAGSRRNVLSNSLVLVVPADAEPTILALSDLKNTRVRRIAIGEPSTVPAGAYTQVHLQRLGLWADLAPKFLPLTNARAVLAAVEAGNVDAGFVYKTDALPSRRVRVVLHVPAAEGPNIVYAGAVVQGSRRAEAARSYLAFLTGPEAQASFQQHGFIPLPPADPPQN